MYSEPAVLGTLQGLCKFMTSVCISYRKYDLSSIIYPFDGGVLTRVEEAFEPFRWQSSKRYNSGILLYSFTSFSPVSPDIGAEIATV